MKKVGLTKSDLAGRIAAEKKAANEAAKKAANEAAKKAAEEAKKAGDK